MPKCDFNKVTKQHLWIAASVINFLIKILTSMKESP